MQSDAAPSIRCLSRPAFINLWKRHIREAETRYAKLHSDLVSKTAS
jgi:hypothetical protein